MIYLASPYYHEDPEVMHQRYLQVLEAAAMMLRAGHIVYSPIVHNHPIAQAYALPRDFDFWMRIDLDILRRCDALWVLMMEGWDRSKGVSAEKHFAEECNIKTIHISPELWRAQDY